VLAGLQAAQPKPTHRTGRCNPGNPFPRTLPCTQNKMAAAPCRRRLSARRCGQWGAARALPPPQCAWRRGAKVHSYPSPGQPESARVGSAVCSARCARGAAQLLPPARGHTLVRNSCRTTVKFCAAPTGTGLGPPALYAVTFGAPGSAMVACMPRRVNAEGAAPSMARGMVCCMHAETWLACHNTEGDVLVHEAQTWCTSKPSGGTRWCARRMLSEGAT